MFKVMGTVSSMAAVVGATLGYYIQAQRIKRLKNEVDELTISREECEDLIADNYRVIENYQALLNEAPNKED